MPRILAIDYGTKRTGIAVTDPAKIIAQALTTVMTVKALGYIKDYVAREPVELFVVGEPFELDNMPSPIHEEIENFIRQLGKQFPDIPLKRIDERFTSTLAHQTVIQSGVGKKKRRNKDLYDKISAVIILQSWLEKTG